MLDLVSLREFGANVDEGLARCIGNEALYLRLVDTIFADKNFDTLAEAVNKNDLKTAFESAHALKGVLGNLSLTPLYEPVAELTELLRAGTPGDYTDRVNAILEKRKALQDIRNR